MTPRPGDPTVSERRIIDALTRRDMSVKAITRLMGSINNGRVQISNLRAKGWRIDTVRDADGRVVYRLDRTHAGLR